MFTVNGNTYETHDQAMRAYAAGGFVGRIEAATPAQTTKPDMAATKRLADALGVALPDTWFPAGTEMIEEGKQTYRAHARRHEEKDPMKGQAISLAMEIEAENRTAFAVDLADLTLKAGAHGETLVSRDGGSKACPLTAHAAGQLLSRAGMGRAAWAFMHTMDAQLRADWWKQAKRADAFEDRTVQAVCRKGPEGYAIAGILGAKYDIGAAPANVLLRRLAASVSEDARGDVHYDPVTSDVRVSYSYGAPVEYDAKVGDVFRIGGGFSTNDMGGGSFRVWNEIVRIICINCTIMNAKSTERINHQGSFGARIQNSLTDHVRTVHEGGREFLDAWNLARDMQVDIDQRLAEYVADIKARLSLRQSTKASLDRALRGAFEVEPGDTEADVLNAVTRAAHEPERFGALLTQIEQWELESYAGGRMAELVAR
jgi:hypothetical protein